MDVDRSGFPTRRQLWQGAILYTIAEAISVVNPPISGYADQVWKGSTYSFSDGQGGEGRIAFVAEGVVAGFFDHESPRSPWSAQAHGSYDWRPLFRGISIDLMTVAEREIFPYFVDTIDGDRVPVMTAAMWGRHEQCTAAEPWTDVFMNGARIFKAHLLDPKEEIKYLVESYGLSLEQVAVLRALFTRKLERGDEPILVTPYERGVILRHGHRGVDLSRDLLRSIGITLG